MSEAMLAAWRSFGEARIPENFEFFSGLVGRARDFVGARDPASASVFASIAAFHASVRHCGIWSSPRLERLLVGIGRSGAGPRRRDGRAARPAGVQRVCHVATSVMAIGGLSQMLRRWVNEDGGRTHSLVLTRQAHLPVPPALHAAVTNSGGRVFRLDLVVGDLVGRARRLASLAADADVVVLHVHPNDVVPCIAFAQPDFRPPVVYLDHADHSFWIGVGVSDVVANMRDSGGRLSRDRRGVKPERITLLPTILDPRRRTMSRLEAKQRLGLPESSTVLLSVARARKYRSVDGSSFLDAHVPILERYPDAVLVVVGPGEADDWLPVIRQMPGRIVALPEREAPDDFFQAADIYVDSYPFVSITSLLEAGSYGVPGVSRYPYGPDGAVLGADMPGLAGALVRPSSDREYGEVVCRLVEDKTHRLQLGQRLCDQITREHTGSNWLRSLGATYELACALPRSAGPPDEDEEMRACEPDVFVESIHGGDRDAARDTDVLIKSFLPLMPLGPRLAHWRSLRRRSGAMRSGRYGAVPELMPEWLNLHIGRVRRAVLSA